MSNTEKAAVLFDESEISEIGDDRTRTVINRALFFVDQASVRVVFYWYEPLFRFTLSDSLTLRYAAVHLRLGKLATQEELAQAFGHSVATQRRWEKAYQTSGLQGLIKGKPSGRPLEIPGTLDGVLRKWFAEGVSNREMAHRLSVSDSTIHRALARLGLHRQKQKNPELPWADDSQDGMSPNEGGETEVEAESTAVDKKQAVDAGAPVENSDAIAEPVDGLGSTVGADEVDRVKRVSARAEGCVVRMEDGGKREWTRDENVERKETASPPTQEGSVAAGGAEDDEAMLPRFGESLEDVVAYYEERGFTIDRDPDDRNGDRFLARIGELEDALPLFADRPSLRQAGVLLAVPLLVKSGLLDVFADVYHSLAPAFYGLRTTVVVLLLSALLRIKRPEHLKEYNPCELGHVVGLDRFPEVKTVRRKLEELASRERAVEVMFAMAERRIQEDASRVAFLYVDGHVREYHGHHPLSKTKKSQSQVAKPAATDNWVHDAYGEPLLVVTSEMNESLTQVLEPILQDVKKLVGDRRPTAIFDRGGYSAKLFARLVKLGFDVMTYRKGTISPWPQSHFVEQEYVIDGRSYRRKIAERQRVRVGRLRGKRKKASRRLGPQFFWMREVRVLRSDGRQTAILTTREDLAGVEVPYRQFHRWRQENYFKYMEAEFELDGLVEYAVQDVAEGADRPNPARRPIERKLTEARARVQGLQAKLGAAVGRPGRSPQRTVQGFKIAQADLRAELSEAEEEVSRLVGELQALPKRVPADDLKTLTTEKKLIVDTIKMTAYQVETELLGMLRDNYCRADDEGRTLLQAAFQSTARLEVREEELYVELAPQSSPHRSAAIRALCEKLNAIGAKFPGTHLRLNLAIQPHEPLINAQGVCQEF